jgi:hypothetical protein
VQADRITFRFHDNRKEPDTFNAPFGDRDLPSRVLNVRKDHVNVRNLRKDKDRPGPVPLAEPAGTDSPFFRFSGNDRVPLVPRKGEIIRGLDLPVEKRTVEFSGPGNVIGREIKEPDVCPAA